MSSGRAAAAHGIAAARGPAAARGIAPAAGMASYVFDALRIIHVSDHADAPKRARHKSDGWS